MAAGTIKNSFQSGLNYKLLATRSIDIDGELLRVSPKIYQGQHSITIQVTTDCVDGELQSKNNSQVLDEIENQKRQYLVANAIKHTNNGTAQVNGSRECNKRQISATVQSLSPSNRVIEHGNYMKTVKMGILWNEVMTEKTVLGAQLSCSSSCDILLLTSAYAKEPPLVTKSEHTSWIKFYPPLLHGVHLELAAQRVVTSGNGNTLEGLTKLRTQYKNLSAYLEQTNSSRRDVPISKYSGAYTKNYQLLLTQYILVNQFVLLGILLEWLIYHLTNKPEYFMVTKKQTIS